ncbi:MAG: AAA family ATPase [Blautia sp.]|nr:AAA family ATPase [Blautia sp.]
MGVYVNPGNAGFKQICRGDYVDKTGLIALLNKRIGVAESMVCISRPRRFGKSFAAKMLTAYYDCSCDSHELFDDKEIARDGQYSLFLNNFTVICLDITGFISEAKAENRSLREVPAMIRGAIVRDLRNLGWEPEKDETLNDLLLRYVDHPGGKQIIFVIDEWDAVIREAKDDSTAQDAYLNLLRGWFKNTNFTSRAVAAAYMTGILPIKKDGSQSAISDFEEFTMIDPFEFAAYVGFTEKEVRNKCQDYGVDFLKMKQWYDGYSFEGIGSVYNPNSVMKAVRYQRFKSFWTETSAAEGLLDYISKDYHGLTKTIAELIGGIEVRVDPVGFANDLTTFRGKDDVLTLMIHLGYLAYDSEKKTVRIPNEEIRMEFQRAVREVKHAKTLERVEESDRLFLDTIQGNGEAVAAEIEKIHREETAPLHYNNEESLRSVIKLAYYTYRDHYIQFEELPGGEGYADVVYLPRQDSEWPALVIELKWNKSADGAISQILDKKYPEVLKNYGKKILLVGINYSKKASDGEKRHTCRIVELQH